MMNLVAGVSHIYVSLCVIGWRSKVGWAVGWILQDVISELLSAAEEVSLYLQSGQIVPTLRSYLFCRKPPVKYVSEARFLPALHESKEGSRRHIFLTFIHTHTHTHTLTLRKAENKCVTEPDHGGFRGCV